MKKIIVISLLALNTALSVQAQKITDSAILNMTDQELGLHLFQKSQDQKTAGYLLAGVAVASFIALPFVFEDEFMNGTTLNGTLALYCIGFGSTIASMALLSSGNRNAGKAQMLQRTISPDEAPGYELDMGFHYKKKATRQRIIGISLLSSGLIMTVIANNSYNYESSNSANNIVSIAGAATTIASLPFLLSAAKNNGRATVLLKKQSIPFSYYSKPIGLNSISLSIPLSNSR